jgi:L-threonylcarbamoyladenylate synthase
LLSEYEDVKKYTNEFLFDNSSHKLFDKPPTIIYPNCCNELKHLSNSNNEIAFRVTPINFLKKIINEIDFPLISTSANISGDAAPKNFKTINDSILQSVDLILNFETKSSGKPSTIIKFNLKGEIQYIRK